MNEFSLRYIFDGSISPSGNAYAYTLTGVNQDTLNEYRGVWLVKNDLHRERISERKEGWDFHPKWSNDGKCLAYISKTKGVDQIFIRDFSTGKNYQVTQSISDVGTDFDWSPDSTRIVFSAARVASSQILTIDPYHLNRKYYRADGMGYLDAEKHDLFVLDLDKKSIRQLTDNNADNRFPRWSPDGKYIASLVYFSEEADSPYPHLQVVDKEGRINYWQPEWGNVFGICWLSNPQEIAFTGRPSDVYVGKKKDLWILNLTDHRLKSRTSRLKNGVGGLLTYDMPVFWENEPDLIFPDKRQDLLYTTVQNQGEIQIFYVNRKGDEQWGPVTAGDHSYHLEDGKNNQLLLIKSTIFEPSVLERINVRNQQIEELENPNPHFPRVSFQKDALTSFQFPSQDGTLVEGWYIAPEGQDPPYPVILNIHGGPHEAYGHRFVFDFHLQVSRGFAVVFINQRGSTGYGDKFSQDLLQNWGGIDLQDLLSGLDALIERGIVDPERIGVYGLSGGGYLACWSITQTKRFTCAVAENPVTNWISFYGTSDIGVDFCEDEFGGSPFTCQSRYIEASPVFYSQQCSTPTLLIAGERDFRCPPGQAEEFFAGLIRAQCPVEMVRFPEGSHTASINGLPIYRKKQNEVMISWFEKFLQL